MLRLPAACASVDVHPGTGYVGPRLGLPVWFSLYPDCRGSASLPAIASDASLSVPTDSSGCGVSPLLQLPQRLLSSSFCFLCFVLPRYASIHVILSGGQGLLLVFRPCSVRTVTSIDVVLIHPWREMYSVSTYSSTFLSPFYFFLFLLLTTVPFYGLQGDPTSPS